MTLRTVNTANAIERLNAGRVLVRKVLGRHIRSILVICSIVLGLRNIPDVLLWLSPSFIYTKDILVEFLTVKAIADQTDPFVPLQELASRYLNGLAISTFDHPSPHPPTLGLLMYPVVFLDYPAAATAWLVLEIICLGAAIYLLGRVARIRLSTRWVFAITIMSLAWFPVLQELQRGQVGIILLLILTGCCLCLRSKHPFLGGFLLSFSLLVKQIAWPIIVLLLLRKQWRTLMGAATVLVPGYLLTLLIIGFDALARYFLDVLPNISAFYGSLIWNSSLWTIGYRLFGGTTGIVSPPLVQLPSVVPIASVLVPAMALLMTYYLTRPPFDLQWAIGLMLCLSAIVNPVAWPHYLLIVLPVVALVIHQLVERGFPTRETGWALLVGALLFVDHPRWEIWAFNLAGQTPAVDGGLLVLPFIPALLLMGPTVAVAMLAWLCVVLESQGRQRREGQAHSSPSQEATRLPVVESSVQ